MGKPTAHDLKLDADMILVAQAALLIDASHDVTVIADNVAHLGIFIPAANWQSIP